MTGSAANPEPLGFPRCADCAYRLTGAPEICARCATATLPQVAEAHCLVCSQALSGPGTVCGNRICGWSLEQRHFTRVDAVAMYDGALKQTLPLLKYNGRLGWALIYGRLIIGWLDNHADQAADIDLILGNPTSPDRKPRHIEEIMRAASAANRTGRWPVADPDHPVPTKRQATAPSAGTSWQAKMAAAEEHAAAIDLHTAVAGRKLLLVDDVFTTGAQMTTIARLLRSHGAREVRGLVLARAPWR
ncbi:phosphoribosyltransferase family protein [Kitasatospora sp. NPDC085895]|uniref:ComF family protein n=1 Tax=Kitasatospora sp. NPDC085895 TaxID=3155057 RepID=UPI00344EE67D